MASTTLPPLNATPPDWRDLALLSEEEVEAVDIAVLNLAAVQGMPGGPTPKQAERCLIRLDNYARTIAGYTKKRVHEFRRYRHHYQGSVGRFRVLKMVWVLQNVYRLRYNPDKIPDDSIHTEADAFIHGPLVGAGGTCASVPVVIAAIGRRLGYPIQLVTSPNHLFCRWEDPHDRFNIEVINEGVCHPPDEFYRTEGKEPFGIKEEQYFCYMQTKTPRQEFASFLQQRAHHWHDRGNFRQCIDAFTYACKLDPENTSLQRWHVARLLDWRSAIFGRIPLNFPLIRITFPPRRYPWLPENSEKQMIFCQTVEDILEDPSKAHWWDALRQSPYQRPRNVPTSIQLTMAF